MNIFRRETLGTVALATAFTVLIWLWAEGENREERITTLTLAFATAIEEDRYLVRARDVNDPNDLNARMQVRVSLEGPNLTLDRLIRDLGVVQIAIENPDQDPNRTIDLLPRLQALPLFDQVGITVQRVTPPSANIQIEEILTQTVPVMIDVDGYAFDDITVTPPRVQVAMPADIWATFVQPQFGDSIVFAELPVTRLAELSPGTMTTFEDVPLRLHDRLGAYDAVELLTETVDVELSLANRTIEISWVVPVKVMMLPRDESLYDVIITDEDELIRDVIISGDAEAIARLRNREVFVYAVLNLTSDELEQAIDEKQIEWWLPPGLEARTSNTDENDRPVIPLTIQREPESQP